MEKKMFASDEWIEIFYGNAKTNKDLLDSIKNFEGPIVLIIRPHQTKLPNGLVIWINAGNGEVRDVQKLVSPEEKPSKFKLIASYNVWEDIAKGEKGILKSILLGKVQVEGNRAILLKQIKTAKVLEDILRNLPTVFA